MTASFRFVHCWSAAAAIGLVLGCSGQTFSSGPGAGGAAGGADSGSSGAGGTSGAGGSPDASAGSGGIAAGGTSAGGAATGGTVGTGGASTGGASTGGTATGGASTGGTATGGMGTVGSDAATYVCSGSSSFSVTVDKGCTADQNCGLVTHLRDCCGTELVMAVNHGAVTSFNEAESYCDSKLPKCGCASSGVFAEDGTMVPFGGEKLIAASCTNGTCESHYDGNTFKCGDKLCTDLQYCETVTPPLIGSATYSCNALPNGCNACNCISTTLGCSCSQTQGHLTVACVGS